MNDFYMLLMEHDITLIEGCGEFKERQVRFLGDIGIFQIGDDNFDRWANSVELEFDVWLPRGIRQLKRWLQENTND